MQRLTAALTLIAYLIGGWIAPAIHHHHSGGMSADSSCRVACAHVSSQHRSDGSRACQRPANASSCQHSHGPVATTGIEGDTGGTDRPSSGRAAFRDGVLGGCSGLCALCIARTLSCQRERAARISFENVPLGKLNLTETVFVPQLARGQATSRGPPLFV